MVATTPTPTAIQDGFALKTDGGLQILIDLPHARVRVEIRTVNHRFADVRLRLPTELADQERAIRRAVLARVRAVRHAAEDMARRETRAAAPRP